MLGDGSVRSPEFQVTLYFLLIVNRTFQWTAVEKLPREVYITFGGISVLFAMAEQKNKDVLILPIVLQSRTEKEIRRQASAME